MDAEDFACYNRGYRKAVERIYKCFPNLYVAPPFAFIVKAIDSGDVGALVISPQKEEILWKFEFVAKQKKDRLQALLSPIYIIT